RLQGVHAAELSPERRAARDHLQQDQVRRPPGQDEGHHRERGGGGLRRHVLEGHRPLLEGLHRAPDQGQGAVLQDPRLRAAEAARDLRHGGGQEVGGQPAVQGNRRVAEDVRRARGQVGPGHQRVPPHGLQSLLRAQEELARRDCRRPSGRSSGESRVAGPVASPMSATRLLRIADSLSSATGKAFAWLIMALTFVVSIEVFKRYILNAPTAWIYDLNSMLYGTLFMMCGAYTLAAAGHVRADFVYIYMKPRGQAALDLSLYLLFFIPGILGLIYAGADFAADSWRIGEHSTVTAEGPPVYQFKAMIPLAGALVMLQGLAEILRCIVCLRTGTWPARLEDVEEIDVLDTQLGHSQYVDEESRIAVMEGAKA